MLPKFLVTQEEVDRARNCLHPEKQIEGVGAYFDGGGILHHLKGCLACGGVLDAGILIRPLFPEPFYAGMNWDGIESIRQRIRRKREKLAVR